MKKAVSVIVSLALLLVFYTAYSEGTVLPDEISFGMTQETNY